jgi:hypothetical protein
MRGEGDWKGYFAAFASFTQRKPVWLAALFGSPLFLAPGR